MKNVIHQKEIEKKCMNPVMCEQNNLIFCTENFEVNPKIILI